MMTQSQKNYATRLTAAVLLAGAFFLLPTGSHYGEAVANPLNPATNQDGQITAPNQW